MAVAHIQYDQTLPHGAQLRTMIVQLETGIDALNELFATMTQMLDAGTVTVYFQNKFGFPDLATAQAGYNELNSLQLKLNSDASVTNMKTALLQAFAKFG